MARVFLVVEIEDATVESMADCFGDLEVAGLLEDSVRIAASVPEGKSITIAPFRNGIIFSPDSARRIKDSIEGWDSVPEDYGWNGPEDREIVETIEAGLRYIGDGGAGG